LTAGSQSEAEDAELLQEEVGDRDPTYLRTHAIVRYDYRTLDGSITTNRLRLKLQYAFGPFQRSGVSVLIPILWRDAPMRSANGLGEVEVQAAMNVYRTERLRMGGAVQGTFGTATDPLLGANATTVKPSWALTTIVSGRVEVTGVVYYVRSIPSDLVVNQFEPDATVNVRIGRITSFIESDSYYDFRPERWAPTLKSGISVGLGTDGRWVITGYYSVGLNDRARRTQQRCNIGLDLTWFPFEYR
jgi:hypothetical protein